MNNIITKSNRLSEADGKVFFENSGSRKAVDTSSIYQVTPVPSKQDKSNIVNFLQAVKLFVRNQHALAERFKIIRKTNLETARRLRNLGKVEEAKKLEKCSTSAYRIFCKKRTWKYFLNNRCSLKCCGFCQRTKSIRETRRTAPAFAIALANYGDLKAVELTLTQKSKSNRSLKVSQIKLKDDFAKLRNRKIFENVIGGRWQLEETISSGMWHPHLHVTMLVDKDINQKELAKNWKQITGDSEILDIKTIDSDLKSIVNTISYAFKPATVKDMTDKQLLELLDTKNERTGATFGIIFDSAFDESEFEIVEDTDNYQELLKEIEITKKIGSVCDCGCNSIIQGEEVTLDELIESFESSDMPDFVKEKEKERKRWH